MIEIALTAYMLLCAAGIVENILCINGTINTLHDTQHGIRIALDIAWIIICAVALCVGGTFASAAITVATVWLILCIIGDFSAISNYKSISDAIGLAIHIALLVLLLAV
jgi:hypothetical protein